jgi:heptosyltransferase-2
MYHAALLERDAEARGPIDLGACRKILVAKLDRLGDWILCTPFLERLKHHAPDAAITALVRRDLLALATASPFIDRAVGLEPGARGIVNCCGGTASAVRDFRRDYALGAFDLAIVPRWDVDFDGAAALA